MSEDERMLARVRRLLAKAEAAATEAERDAYNAKAAELIARYGIEEALLAAREPGSQFAADRVVPLDAPYARDKGTLLAAVATPLGVRPILRSQRAVSGTTWSMHLFGTSVDLERVDVLFTSLLVQAALGLAVARPGDPGESVAAYRRSWMIGFAYIVQQRLVAAEEAARAEAEAREQVRATQGAGPPASVSLVLADRDALVDRAVAEAYPRVRNARARTLTGTGSADGAAAGRRADLGGRRLGGRARASLR